MATATRADWKMRYLDTYFGQVTAITPEDGLMKITVSNPLGSMDFHVDPRSRFVKMAQGLIPQQGIGKYNDCRIPAVQSVTYRKSERYAGERGHHYLVPCYQIVEMEEARR